ncbi:MAG: hypothetical protein ABR499_13555 [Gemmatimonadaceae bacterium]
MHSLLRSSRPRLWLVCAMAFIPTVALPAQSPNARHAGATTPTVMRKTEILVAVSEPAERFAAARAALARNDRARAAVDIRDAATFVRGQAAVATGTVKTDLEEAARDLDRIEMRVRKGTLKTPRELDAALRRSDRGLARHHFERAVGAWERRETAKAGREIRLAAHYTERLAKDAGTGVERVTRDVVRGTRTLSAKLIDGVGWTSDEVGNAFGKLGHEIDRLGADVGPRRG